MSLSRDFADGNLPGAEMQSAVQISTRFNFAPLLWRDRMSPLPIRVGAYTRSTGLCLRCLCSFAERTIGCDIPQLLPPRLEKRPRE